MKQLMLKRWLLVGAWAVLALMSYRVDAEVYHMDAEVYCANTMTSLEGPVLNIKADEYIQRVY